MSFKLWKSEDFGVSYILESEFDSVEESEEFSGKLDASYRWYLEDSVGKIVDYCDLFDSVITQMRGEKRVYGNAAFATEDKILGTLLRSIGIEIWDTATVVDKVRENDEDGGELKTFPGMHVGRELKNSLH